MPVSWVPEPLLHPTDQPTVLPQNWHPSFRKIGWHRTQLEMNNSSVILQPIHTKALVPFLPLPQKYTKEYYRAWAHRETSREIWKPWRKWEKGKTTNCLYYPLISFDPECLFLLINSNYRSILHYHLHGVWSLLVLKKNVDTLFVVTKEVSQSLAQTLCERNQSCSLSSPTPDC